MTLVPRKHRFLRAEEFHPKTFRAGFSRVSRSHAVDNVRNLATSEALYSPEVTSTLPA